MRSGYRSDYQRLGVRSTIHMEHLSRDLTCLCQVEDGVNNVLYFQDFAQGLQDPKRVLGIILVQWRITTPGATALKRIPALATG